MRNDKTVVEGTLKDIKAEEPGVRALHGGLVCRATEDSEGSERVRRQQQRERADVVVRDEQADPNGDKLQHRNRDCGGLEQQGSGNRDRSPSTVPASPNMLRRAS